MCRVTVSTSGQKRVGWPYFSYCLDVAILNAWLLFRIDNSSIYINQLAFRREIVDVYLRRYAFSNEALELRSPRNVGFERKVPSKVRRDGRDDVTQVPCTNPARSAKYHSIFSALKAFLNCLLFVRSLNKLLFRNIIEHHGCNFFIPESNDHLSKWDDYGQTCSCSIL